MRGLYLYHSHSSVKLPYCHPSPQFPVPISTTKSPLFILQTQKQQRLSLHTKPSNLNIIKAAMGSSTPETKPFSVLFVCLGNICRSPAAEGVFRDLVKKRGLDSNFSIDSAGTIGYHEGGPADPRMRAASKKRGVEITSISRPIRPSDFLEFDLILAMDKQNREDILSAFEKWRHREPLPDAAAKKVRLMCSYCKKHQETEVPDPYYGGTQGFEKVKDFLSLLTFKGPRLSVLYDGYFLNTVKSFVLDLLEDACESLLDSILAEKPQLVDS